MPCFLAGLCGKVGAVFAKYAIYSFDFRLLGCISVVANRAFIPANQLGNRAWCKPSFEQGANATMPADLVRGQHWQPIATDLPDAFIDAFGRAVSMQKRKDRPMGWRCFLLKEKWAPGGKFCPKIKFNAFGVTTNRR